MKFNMIWVDRKFMLDQPIELFPTIVERLRGTPARLEETVRGLPENVLTRPEGDKWSIQEHVGHMLRAERLWGRRIEDIMNGEAEMYAADLKNNFLPNANQIPIQKILADFRSMRIPLIEKLDALTESDVARSAIHPRLNQPMRIIDQAYFAAEHDDHHLACITRIKRDS
ncbi:MAG: DinB family protein [candidate division Zixibacteria bacterium]|nr:DinB family protein [candidate division Zixibacteria bacterium]